MAREGVQESCHLNWVLSCHEHWLIRQEKGQAGHSGQKEWRGQGGGSKKHPGEYGKFQGWFFNLSTVDILGRTVLQGWQFVHCHAFTSISGPKQHPHLIVTTEKCLQTQPNVPPGGRGGTPWLRTMLEVVLPCSCSRYKVRSGRNGSQWSR